MSDNITISRAVVERAIEALRGSETPTYRAQYDIEIDALVDMSAALEQPQVKWEPVAWGLFAHLEGESVLQHPIRFTKAQAIADVKTYAPGANLVVHPLYTHSLPRREPLTEDEINTIWRNSTHMTIVEVVRAIEAAHGIGGES